MEFPIHVVCSGRGSLRDQIVKDRAALEEYQLFVEAEKKNDRKRGWAKLKSNRGIRGAINIQWDRRFSTLKARLVTRGKPGGLSALGNFLDYLLIRWRKRVRSITASPP
jgi:hypothetical protein